jgi:hypothetical protein
MSTFKLPSSPRSNSDNKLNHLKLDTRVNTLKALDKSGPLSAQTPQSAFLNSPIVASALLINARKLAVLSPSTEKPNSPNLETIGEQDELQIVAGLGQDGGIIEQLPTQETSLQVPGQYVNDGAPPLSPGGLGKIDNVGKDPIVLHPVEVPVAINMDKLKSLFGKFMGWHSEPSEEPTPSQPIGQLTEKLAEATLKEETTVFEQEQMSEIEIFTGQMRPVAISYVSKSIEKTLTCLTR